MNKIDVSAEMYRIRRQYPELWNFMEAYCNSQCFGVVYEELDDAAKDYAAINPEHATRRLLDQLRRARADDTLNAIMDNLALTWGGMAIVDDGFAILIDTLEECVRDFGPQVVPLRRA